eukprot:IDg21814t1
MVGMSVDLVLSPEDENEKHPANSIIHGETNGIEGTNKTHPLRRRLADDALFIELDTLNGDFADMLDYADQASLGSLDSIAFSKNATDSMHKIQKSSNGAMEEGSKKRNGNKKRPKSSSDPFASEYSRDVENGIELTETMHEISPKRMGFPLVMKEASSYAHHRPRALSDFDKSACLFDPSVNFAICRRRTIPIGPDRANKYFSVAINAALRRLRAQRAPGGTVRLLAGRRVIARQLHPPSYICLIGGGMRS